MQRRLSQQRLPVFLQLLLLLLLPGGPTAAHLHFQTSSIIGSVRTSITASTFHDASMKSVALRNVQSNSLERAVLVSNRGESVSTSSQLQIQTTASRSSLRFASPADRGSSKSINHEGAVRIDRVPNCIKREVKMGVNLGARGRVGTVVPAFNSFGAFDPFTPSPARGDAAHSLLLFSQHEIGKTEYHGNHNGSLPMQGHGVADGKNESGNRLISPPMPPRLNRHYRDRLVGTTGRCRQRKDKKMDIFLQPLPSPHRVVTNINGQRHTIRRKRESHRVAYSRDVDEDSDGGLQRGEPPTSSSDDEEDDPCLDESSEEDEHYYPDDHTAIRAKEYEETDGEDEETEKALKADDSRLKEGPRTETEKCLKGPGSTVSLHRDPCSKPGHTKDKKKHDLDINCSNRGYKRRQRKRPPGRTVKGGKNSATVLDKKSSGSNTKRTKGRRSSVKRRSKSSSNRGATTTMRSAGGYSRREKSLGLLGERFVVMYAKADRELISLDEAANRLEFFSLAYGSFSFFSLASFQNSSYSTPCSLFITFPYPSQPGRGASAHLRYCQHPRKPRYCAAKS